MNISTTTVFASSGALRRPASASAAGELLAAANRLAQRILRMPLLLWSLVVAAALLAFFVHLLNAQVLRGEKLREEQRAAATRPVARVLIAGDLQHPGNALISTRQSLTRP